MEDLGTLISLALAGLVFGALSWTIANTRDLGNHWFIYGFLGGPIAVVALLILPGSTLASDKDKLNDDRG